MVKNCIELDGMMGAVCNTQVFTYVRKVGKFSNEDPVSIIFSENILPVFLSK